MIVAIVGPTGVGKTKMSVALAKKYNAVVINCDAMQVYKDLNIGTAKIKESEKEGVPHYLFDFVNVEENYTVADYQRDARALLEKYKDRNIIFVGGTGLYLKAALYDYRFPEEYGPKKDYSNFTNEELQKMCLKKDKNCNIHVNNRKRLIRFLEKKETEIVPAHPLYPAIFIGLTTKREKLYKMIDDRVLKMIEEGLLEEVKPFYEKNIRSKALMSGIGYKELYDYFDGTCSLEEAIETIKQKSRHYAKRQYTFFRHQLPVKWFDVNYEDFSKTINDVETYIEHTTKDLF